MNEMPEIGKISPEIFTELIFPRLGAKNKDVIVGPQHGVDVAIVNIGGKAVSLTTDPVFIVPEYGWERAAWFAINILASDSVTSGLRPGFLSIDLNLPMDMTKKQLEIMWDTMHRECEKLGITVVTGHTARYENCHYPMVGGATVIGVGELDEYVTPKFCRAGDKIIITKGPAIEASALFAVTFPKRVEKACGAAFAKRAERVFWQMTVVEDALTAASVGVREEGVTAMHDATECGLWGGLYEVASASDVGMRIDREKIPVQEEVRKICELFGIDPFCSISEGTLVLACKKHRTTDVLSRFKEKGILAATIGETLPEEHGITLVERGAVRRHPELLDKAADSPSARGPRGI